MMASIDLRLKIISVDLKLITEQCPSCGIVFAWPAEFHETVRKGGERCRGYCPNGHVIQWSESEASTLRRERDRLKQQAAQKDDEIRLWKNTANQQREQVEHERRRANGYKGHATRITKRAKAGVCPCCNRHFTALERHMATKHPEFTPIEIEESATV